MKGEPGKVINELRAQGWRVDVQHERPLESKTVPGRPLGGKLYTEFDRKKNNQRLHGATYQFLGKGGITTVELRSPNGSIFRGEARVHPNDNFNRRRGLRIALGRALKSVDNWPGSANTDVYMHYDLRDGALPPFAPPLAERLPDAKPGPVVLPINSVLMKKGFVP